jgi:signal peptidase I
LQDTEHGPESAKKKPLVGAILLAFAVAALMKLFCFDFIIAEGQSMLPALKNGTLLFVNKLAFGFRPPFSQKYLVRWALPEHNDVVLFWTPFGDLAVKRFVGLVEEGDDVTARALSRWMARGDNEPASFDSRSYGPVPLDNIMGKALGY